MKNVEFEMLNLSAHDPKRDVVVAYVDVSKMPPARARDYVARAKEYLNPLFEERGFTLVAIGQNETARVVDLKIEKKPADHTAFNTAKPKASEL